MRLHHVFVCLLLRFELTSSWIPGNFIFTTCQGGAERALKEEMAREYPTLNFAFSRPGLVTWKCPTAASPDVEIRSIFARCYGVSLGMAATFEDVYSIALDVSKTLDTNVLLHVFPRDDGSVRSEHPAAIATMQQRILNATQELIALDVVAQQSVFSSSDESVYVLDVILGETSEKMFVGLHKHDDTYRNKASGKSVKWRNHVRQPGGVPKVDLPAEAPSRAYLKIEEAIEWSMLQLNRGDTALEIGSAPGGACYSLLQRGLRVYGMDPTPPDRKHAPVVAQHPKFREIRGVLETIDYALLPEKVDWLLCDANISPEVALPHLISLLKLYMSSIRGIFFTVKLGEDIWSNKKEPLVNYIDSLQDRIVDKTTIVTCASTQLPSNRQELLLCGLSKLGMERFKACVR